jgi:hypothetical protein
MNRHVRIAFSLLAVIVLGTTLMVGCQGSTKAGTKYNMLPTRELEARVEGDLASVHDTAVAVLRDEYQFTIDREAKDRIAGEIRATTALRDKVTIQTYRVGNNITTIQVWAGPMGNKARAEDILNTIEQRLGGDSMDSSNGK